MSGFILAIDQGTTSSRAIVFDQSMKVVATGQREFKQHYPASGWVEHDPEDIWQSVVTTCKEALRAAKLSAAEIAAIGITNQRETVVIWDKVTGKPIHNAIVWQDRRTSALCQRLRKQGLERKFSQKTGLLLDPYFSGTKIAWLLDNVKGARRRAGRGELIAGTIDSFLIWRLTGGKVHATDATNASRCGVRNKGPQMSDEQILERLCGAQP
jgi:glycerol kinase